MKKLFASLLLLASALLFMAPSYNNQPALTLQLGTCQYLLLQENPTSGSFSQQFFVPTAPQQAAPNISFEFLFASNPGTLNYQIQDADTDATGNYVTLPAAGTLTSCPQTAGGAYTCRIELNPWRGRYGRIYTQTQNSSAVNLSVQVCR